MPIETDRVLALHCALGDDAFQVRHMSGHEELGRCFEYRLTLYSENHEEKLESLLGLDAYIQIKEDKKPLRFYDGIVADASYAGSAGRYARYMMTLRPALWLLSHTHDCRVFQDKTVPDILKKVLRTHGLQFTTNGLSRAYAKREFCVQYRESDLDFVSRLMEEEGIYYYFRHEEKKHTLVLADSAGAHGTVPKCEKVGLAATEEDVGKGGVFFDWATTKRVRPGKYALTDFDFTKPAADLNVRSADARKHAHADSEVFDYPGGYSLTKDGEALAQVRLQEALAGHELAEGLTNVMGLYTGALFSLTDAKREDQNREYLIIASDIALDAGAFESGEKHATARCNQRTTTMSSKIRFRPPRVTPNPVIGGPHTATVVGKKQEIWTDPHGRVRVLFHWDRQGKTLEPDIDKETNEDGSCWVRVSQAWAGAGWGSMHLPHAGQEVIVSFLEGDPDKPIVTGRVYNGTHKVWQTLPANVKKSYFRDEGQNHIMMDATDGKQRIELSTPYGNTKLSLGAPNSPEGCVLGTDLCHTETIGQDQNVYVKRDKNQEVTGNSTEKVQMNFTELVHGNVSTTTNGTYTMKVDNAFKFTAGDISNHVHVGESTDFFMGFKHQSFYGVKTEISRSKSIKRVWDKEDHKNYAQVNKLATENHFVGSKKMMQVLGGDGKGIAELTDQGIRLRAKGTEIIIKSDGDVTIKTNKQLQIKASQGVKIDGKEIVLKADATKAPAGTWDSKNIKDLG